MRPLVLKPAIGKEDPDGSDPVGFIDVRDVAEFYLRLVEVSTTGVVNAFGPEAPMSMAELLHGIRAITSTTLWFTWVDTDFLLERQVRPYTNLPLWMPARGSRVGFRRKGGDFSSTGVTG